MTHLAQVVEAATVLVAGLLVRLVLVLLVLALIAGAVLLALAAWRRINATYDWARGLRDAGGVRWRSGLLYAPGHVWLRPRRGGRLTLGIDDLAQRILAGHPRIELPRPGRSVRVGEPIVEIAVDGRTVEIGAPNAGTVLAVNPRLGLHPELIHSDPYGHGWLVRMQASGKPQASLLSHEASRRWLASETRRFERYVEWQLGFATADGGEPFLPPARMLEDRHWRYLVETFLAAPLATSTRSDSTA